LAVDACFIIVVVLVLLALLTACGHGLWLMAAALGRALFGNSAPTPHRARGEECPACREWVPQMAVRCPACDLSLRGATAAGLRDIDAVLRQIRRFRDDGVLDESTFEQLRGECRQSRRRLLKPVPARRPVRETEPVYHPERDAESRGTTPEVTPTVAAARAGPHPVLESPALPAPPASQRSAASVLAAFLEARNILWGEIVGGLLIIGCSIALVISLWEVLERIPYFPFLLFAGITGALFGAGQYTLHRWKLHSTSRGMLAVALLLVPLDFLVLAGLSHGEGGLAEVAIEGAALAALGTLVSVAARDLVPGQRWPATVALAGCAGVELLVPRWLDPAGPGTWLGPLVWLPAVCFAVPCAVAFARAAHQPPLGQRAAGELLGFVGLAAFALATALGFVVYRGGEAEAVAALALPLAVVAVPVLGIGLMVARAPGEETAAGVSAALRTAGTGLALGAMTVMVAAAVLAWPRPGTMLAVGLLNFAVLTAVALRYRLPAAHALALPSLTVAYLTGFHLLAGHLDLAAPPTGGHLLALATSPASGSALIVLVVAWVTLAEVFARQARRLDALWFLGAAGTAALISVLLTLAHPVADAARPAIACGIYGMLALALHLRWRSPALLGTAQLLLALAVLFGVTWGLAGCPWVGADATGLTDPRSLQAYGIGLAALTLVWVLLRTAARSRDLARRLVEGDDPPPHRVVLAGLVVLALGLAVWGAFPGAIAELTPAGRDLAPGDPGSRALAYGPGGWGLLSAVVIVLFAALWEWPAGATLGLTAAAITVPVLAAGLFNGQHAAASALRWGLAGVLLAGSAALWFRRPVAQVAQRLGIVLAPEAPSAPNVRRLLLTLTAAPVLVLTLILALLGFGGDRPSGPDPDSFFGHLGWVASNVVPLMVVSGVLVGHGIRERRPGYIFAAGLITDAALVGGYALHAALGGGLDAAAGIRTAQLGAIGASAWALAWMFARRRSGESETSSARPLIGALAALSAVLNLLLLIGPLLALLLDPGIPLAPAFAVTGDGVGWVALLLAAAALLGHVGPSLARARVHVVATAGLGMGVLAACFASPWDGGTWLSYHVLLATWGAAGAAVIATALAGTSFRRHDFPAPAVRGWAEGIGVVLALLALRGAWEDPGRPYWPAAAALSACGMAVALALSLRRQRHVLASGLLVSLVGLIVWLARGAATPASFLGTQVLCLALASGFWSVVDRILRRTGAPFDLRGATGVFCDGAGWIGLGLLAVVAADALGTRLIGSGAAPGPVPWAALLFLSASFLPALGDANARRPAPKFYAAGLLAVGLALASLGVPREHLGQAAGLLLGAYVLLAAAVAHWAPALLGRVAERRDGPSAAWFLPAQGVVAAVVVVLSAATACSFDAPIDRLAGPLALALLVGAGVIASLNSSSPSAMHFLPSYASLCLGVLFLAECGWSFVNAAPAPWMHRTVALVAALAFTTVAYGVGLARWAERPAWAACGRRLGPILGALALAALVVVLGQEFLLYNPDPQVRRTPMAGWAVAVVAAALAGLMTAQVLFAVRPERDPFGLSERRRTLYVYATELLLVGLFVHVRLNMPWLFGQRFVQYWTFLVMAVAFVGVGLAEFFRRRGLTVLAGPLHRTGVFLPLLPLLAFWVRPPLALQEFLIAHTPGTEPLLRALNVLPTYGTIPSQFDRYSLLWLILGSLYAATALARRSSRYALLAVLAINAALWCLLYHYGWSFLVHPQLWLVPLALIVLVAEHLNRARLGATQAATLRYVGLGTLYLSSTADMFIAGLGHSVLLPLTLALLSVLGVFAGIGLRVRACLFLGVGFLGLVVFSMIWHAAVDLDQTWLWWASGIALGAAILALFALFEKRREDVLRVVDQVRRWE